MALKYRIDTTVYTETTQIEAGGCNSITFKNTGTATVYVKGIPVATNEALEISGNVGEEDYSMYDIRFATGTPTLFIIRKYYID